MTEKIKSIVSKEIEIENEAWARFLYKQYKKKKLTETLSIKIGGKEDEY